MKSEQMNAYLIYPHSTVVEAMQKIDSNAKGILFVVKEKNILIGVITDGDIRRWLIKTGNLQEEVSKIMNLSPRVLYRKDVKIAQEYMAKYQITALPIIETQEGDVSAYIPTNVISITDGQIYLESDLFNSGIRPAVNVGLSVSRVGGAAQVKGMKKVAGTLRLDLAQFREKQAFAQFGSDLDAATKAQLERGQRLIEILKQPQYKPMPVEYQIVSIFAVSSGFTDDISLREIGRFEKSLHEYLGASYKDFMKEFGANPVITDETSEKLKEIISKFANDFKIARAS